MYRKFCMLIIIFLPLLLSGQNTGYNPPGYLKKYTDALAFDLKLEPLSVKKADFHFRCWCIGQVIDIYKDDSGSTLGEITSYAKEYDEMYLGKRSFHSKKLSIKPEVASRIYEIILSSGLAAASTGNTFDWQQKEINGFTFIVESVVSGRYSFKSFPSTLSRKPAKEQVIESFIARLEQILKLRKAYRSFSASIPFWCYTKGTPEVICRKKW